jgi:hypothetical protein
MSSYDCLEIPFALTASSIAVFTLSMELAAARDDQPCRSLILRGASW